jgi:hypothetical protein
MRQICQPRLAEIIAVSLRENMLTGRLARAIECQEDLKEFGVGLSAVREASTSRPCTPP